MELDKNMTIGELRTLTEQYKANVALSEVLFKQNYKKRQEEILKEVFKG